MCFSCVYLLANQPNLIISKLRISPCYVFHIRCHRKMKSRHHVTQNPLAIPLECYQLNSGMKALFIPAVNKVPGYWIQSETDLANKPRNMQIFPHSKFGINRSTGLKVMTKKFVCVRNNFLAITFKPVDRSVPNFKCGKICMFLGLFAKSVLFWIQ